MRREEYIRQPAQGMWSDQRLLVIRIQTSKYVAPYQAGQEGIRLNQCPPRYIDEHGARSQFRELSRAQAMARTFCEAAM